MTLCVGAIATHAVNPNLFKKLPYDPIKDFQPITLIAHVPNVLVVTPEFQKRTGIKSVQDLVAYCKKNPGKLNYASGGNGSAGHMAGELFKSRAKIFMVHIPYAGAAAAQLSVLAGQTDLIFDNLASANANIKAGKLIPLAVTTSQRAAALPNVPTMQECGVADFNISTWYGLFVPAKTPAPIVTKLNSTIVKALNSDALKARLAKLGGESAPCTPEEFSALIRTELAKYAEIVKVSGARVD
jgi:tripartite-type tricarboxylate transporter receptor subunit TctC